MYTNNEDWKIIKKIIDNNTLMFKTKITVDYFEDILAKIIYSLIVKNINEKGVFIPLVDLQALVEDSERVDKLKIINYPYQVTTVEDLLAHIMTFKDENISFIGLEKTITDRYLRKKLKEIATKLEADIMNSTKSTSELLRRYSTHIDNLMYSTDDDRIVMSVEDMLKNEIMYQNDTTKEHFARTGTIIDLENGGLNAPSLTVICGAAKSGKSVSLYQTAIECLKAGRTVLFGTIEIPAAEAYRKIMSAYIGIDFSIINRKELSDEEKQFYLDKVKEFTQLYKDKLFIYYKRSGFCSKDIEIYYNNLQKAGIIIDDIVLDYLFIMKSNEGSLSMVDACGKIPTEVRMLSQITDTRVFSAAQLRAETEKMEITEIGFDNIYFMKNLSFEATYTLVIKSIKGKLGENDKVYSKCLPSRQMWSNIIYHFPEANFNQVTLGEPTECLYVEEAKVEMSDKFIV